jgi:hypothetical protein
VLTDIPRQFPLARATSPKRILLHSCEQNAWATRKEYQKRNSLRAIWREVDPWDLFAWSYFHSINNSSIIRRGIVYAKKKGRHYYR